MTASGILTSYKYPPTTPISADTIKKPITVRIVSPIANNFFVVVLKATSSLSNMYKLF